MKRHGAEQKRGAASPSLPPPCRTSAAGRLPQTLAALAPRPLAARRAPPPRAAPPSGSRPQRALGLSGSAAAGARSGARTCSRSRAAAGRPGREARGSGSLSASASAFGLWSRGSVAPPHRAGPPTASAGCGGLGGNAAVTKDGF